MFRKKLRKCCFKFGKKIKRRNSDYGEDDTSRLRDSLKVVSEV